LRRLPAARRGTTAPAACQRYHDPHQMVASCGGKPRRAFDLSTASRCSAAAASDARPVRAD
jgi:hypothetical protein